jgi:hypothetical protein
MYGTELIEKYFSHHPNKDFDLEFRTGAGFFCGYKSPIYKYEKLADGNIKVYYRDVTELRNVPLIENGVRVGHYRLSEPHTTFIREASFLCVNVFKIVEKAPVKRWRFKDVKIKKIFWSKNLVIHIDNENLNLKIECQSIMPDSFVSK